MKKPQIESSHSARTYPAWAEHPTVGRDPLSARSIIVEVRARAEQLWGEMPTLVIDPTIKAGKLPTWTHMVEALGPTETEDKDGTHLCVIWFSEMPPDSERVLDAIIWDKHAKDFNY